MATDGPMERITAAVPAAVLAAEPFDGALGRIRFRRESASELFRAARDVGGLAHLTMVGGVDWVDHREVIYLLWSDDPKGYLLLSSDLDAKEPHIASATPVWPSAGWHERETWEMVGILFDGHPDLRHLLMPDGYEFFPLLRSFKLHEPEELEVKVRRV